jgi:hypothetical protein
VPLVAAQTWSSGAPNFHACLTPESKSYGFCDTTLSTADQVADLLSRLLTLEEKVYMTQPQGKFGNVCGTTTGELERLNISQYTWLIETNTNVASSTDPELKGRWLIPRRQKGDFLACWDEREAAFGGVCRWPLGVFGSTGPKKIIFFLLSCLGWFFCR